MAKPGNKTAVVPWPDPYILEMEFSGSIATTGVAPIFGRPSAAAGHVSTRCASSCFPIKCIRSVPGNDENNDTSFSSIQLSLQISDSSICQVTKDWNQTPSRNTRLPPSKKKKKIDDEYCGCAWSYLIYKLISGGEWCRVSADGGCSFSSWCLSARPARFLVSAVTRPAGQPATVQEVWAQGRV